jgi:uncharacterized membrane protein YuzA (DUF378 family)
VIPLFGIALGIDDAFKLSNCTGSETRWNSVIYALVSLAVLIIAAFMMRSARDRRVRRERLGVSQTEVIDALEGEQTQIASTVVKLLTEEHRSPILSKTPLRKLP